MRTILRVAAVIALAVGVSGCAMRLTDFEFPKFGLTDKNQRDQAGWAPEQQSSSNLSQQQ